MCTLSCCVAAGGATWSHPPPLHVCAAGAGNIRRTCPPHFLQLVIRFEHVVKRFFDHNRSHGWDISSSSTLLWVILDGWISRYMLGTDPLLLSLWRNVALKIVWIWGKREAHQILSVPTHTMISANGSDAIYTNHRKYLCNISCVWRLEEKLVSLSSQNDKHGCLLSVLSLIRVQCRSHVELNYSVYDVWPCGHILLESAAVLPKSRPAWKQSVDVHQRSELFSVNFIQNINR